MGNGAVIAISYNKCVHMNDYSHNDLSSFLWACAV